MKKQSHINAKVLFESPKFGGTRSIFFFFLSLFFLILTIYFLTSDNKVFFFLPLMIIPVTFMLMLDIHGVEYDSEKKMLRHYSRFFNAKSGDWKDINNFCFLLLDVKILNIKRSEQGQTLRKYDSITFYNVILVNNKDSESDIVIKDFQEYDRAAKFLKKCSTIFQLQTRDLVALKMAHKNIQNKSEYVNY
ncbi:MAG: hypothetical protein A2W91_08865 [Bacteroidetes bacterium GWF2_38_335]|nr:MAG: hypothetical protein A2W91_08865 [Bacteroidetes bacterium GWF2_38_335]OFY80483.1 MAG: hypothetical protein A2281_08590 [Bacteroidetes bacterium RIFOXYA12_FULL_38_20]HBS85908.1 hypothetical protein [Bacteroidales bacterium]